jgi:hypothetical protein
MKLGKSIDIGHYGAVDVGDEQKRVVVVVAGAAEITKGLLG